MASQILLNFAEYREEWYLVHEKYEQTIKDFVIARLLNEEERLRDKWFDFVNIGHITINGGNLPPGDWQVSGF